MSLTSIVNGTPINDPASRLDPVWQIGIEHLRMKPKPLRGQQLEVTALGVHRGLSQPSGADPAVSVNTATQRPISAASCSGVR